MAWIDIGLRLVARMISPTIMLATARFLLVDPSGRRQSYYSEFAPKLLHGDPNVLKLQQWLHKNYSKDLSVRDMASYAGLGERTLLRRFYRATGHNPHAYLQQWRVSKARNTFEASERSVEAIANSVGDRDVSAFRDVFKREIGVPPNEYRYRFSLT